MQLLVHEQTSLWTAEFERACSGRTGLTIRWCPHRSDLFDHAVAVIFVVLVCEADDASLTLIRRLLRSNADLKILCLVSADVDSWELLARELGVAAILPDVTSKRHVIDLVQQWLK
ncbi:hypothetical protein [Planctomicrobium sp. SH527]|uniref:hypothetical protein n=1 Tax=Planctomicrobium sp. SH527 TaxID=3448123 RepID=UPI003F5B4949